MFKKAFNSGIFILTEIIKTTCNIVQIFFSYLPESSVYNVIFRWGWVLAIASLLTLPISFFDGLREFEDLSRSLLLLAIVFFATAVIVENSLYIGLHLEKSIVRWTGGILVFFVYHLSKYKSDHFINHFTSVDPALISGASLLLTYLYAIFYWIVIFLSINYLFLLHNVNRIMSTEGAQGDNRLHYRGVLRLLGHVFGTLGIMVFTIYVISFDIENNTYTRKHLNISY